MQGRVKKKTLKGENHSQCPLWNPHRKILYVCNTSFHIDKELSRKKKNQRKASLLFHSHLTLSVSVPSNLIRPSQLASSFGDSCGFYIGKSCMCAIHSSSHIDEELSRKKRNQRKASLLFHSHLTLSVSVPSNLIHARPSCDSTHLVICNQPPVQPALVWVICRSQCTNAQCIFFALCSTLQGDALNVSVQRFAI